MASIALATSARSRRTLRSSFGFAWRWLQAVWRIGATRRALEELDDHILADIGMDRCAVYAECAKPFWDLPPAARERLRAGSRL